MLASFLVPAGCTFLASLGGEAPQWWNPILKLVWPTSWQVKHMCSTILSPEEGNYRAMKTGTPPSATFLEGASTCMLGGWMSLFGFGEDVEVPIEIQRMSIQGVKTLGRRWRTGR